MRFMLLMIPRGYAQAPAGAMPPRAATAAVQKFNAALREAGVLLALDGLHPPAMGARVSFGSGRPRVVDGPFAEAKEAIGGYWMLSVKSRDEAIEWASRCPAGEGQVIEVRQVHEPADFGDDPAAHAACFPGPA